MRGSKALLLVALMACGKDATPGAAPTTTPPPTTPPPTTTAPAIDGVEHTLREAAVAEESYFTDAQKYTRDLSTLSDQGLVVDTGVTLVVRSATATSYCLQASGGGRTLYYSSASGTIGTAACS